VSEFGNLAAAERALQAGTPDMMVLDVMLPDGDGFLFARKVRSRTDVPILFLTARDQESDRITGLEVGADDYVVKPFSPREVVLRVAAILRRAAGRTESNAESLVYLCGDDRLTIDREAHRMDVNGAPVELTSAEWNILVHLSEHTPHVVSRIQLLDACLGSIAEGSERTIDTHVKNLRRKLGSEGWVQTVRGFGYRFGGQSA
jgi:DNA-binding response OmpR family regulator